MPPSADAEDTVVRTVGIFVKGWYRVQGILLSVRLGDCLP